MLSFIEVVRVEHRILLGTNLTYSIQYGPMIMSYFVVHEHRILDRLDVLSLF